MREITTIVKKIASSPYSYRVRTHLFMYYFESKKSADEFARSRLELLAKLRQTLFDEHRLVFELITSTPELRSKFNELSNLELVLFLDTSNKSEDFERQLFYILRWFYGFYSNSGRSASARRIAGFFDVYFFKIIVSSNLGKYDVRLTSEGRAFRALSLV